jgi:hypothetical protein
MTATVCRHYLPFDSISAHILASSLDGLTIRRACSSHLPGLVTPSANATRDGWSSRGAGPENIATTGDCACMEQTLTSSRLVPGLDQPPRVALSHARENGMRAGSALTRRSRTVGGGSPAPWRRP